MSDEDLAKELNLSPEEAAIILPKLRPKERQTYELLCVTATELVLWQQGGPPPSTPVLIDWDKSKRGRK